MSNNIPFFVGNFGTKNYYYFHSDDVPVNSSRIHERTLVSNTEVSMELDDKLNCTCIFISSFS